MESPTIFSQPWRLVTSPPANGYWNMAVDEILMESAAAHNSLPTLRLFAWSPACLSLGYAQEYSEVDQEALSQRGWMVVRRATGGRAILHTDELTYSVTGSLEDPFFTGSILESYRRIANALVASLALLEVRAELQGKKAVPLAAGINDAVCFEVASNYEITFGGKKLIGSAQSRRNGGFLQHGSLPLKGDLDRINEVIKYPSTADRETSRDRLLDHATTLQKILTREVTWEEAAAAFSSGFESALTIKLQAEPLSRQELERADDLVVSKYGNADWNKRR